MTARALKMVHDTDPKQELWSRAAPLVEGWKVQAELVLIATYLRPEKTQSGIFLPEKARGEDEYQGKVGLIIMMGPDAFKGDPEETKPAVGDWVSVSQMGKGGSMADVEDRFTKRLAASAEMKKAAHAKLAELTPAICKRDHISRVHKDILERVLNG
jgi:co-chaperonin GroES (HSP10)